MLKKLNNLLNILIGCAVGVFVGSVGFLCWDHHAHPGMYELQSAPWYTGILVRGVGMLLIVFVAVGSKLVIRWQLHRQRKPE